MCCETVFPSDVRSDSFTSKAASRTSRTTGMPKLGTGGVGNPTQRAAGNTGVLRVERCSSPGKSTPMISLEDICTVTSYRLSKLYLGIYKYYTYKHVTTIKGEKRGQEFEREQGGTDTWEGWERKRKWEMKYYHPVFPFPSVFLPCLQPQWLCVTFDGRTAVCLLLRPPWLSLLHFQHTSSVNTCHPLHLLPCINCPCLCSLTSPLE